MALEAWSGLIKQNNYLMVKCGAGINEISVRVPALEVLTLGEVLSTPASFHKTSSTLLIAEPE